MRLVYALLALVTLAFCLSFLPVSQAQFGDIGCCIVFGVDESTSLDDDQFTTLKLLVGTVVNSLQSYGEPNGEIVALITFATRVRDHFTFSTYSTSGEVMSHILGVELNGGITNTHLALDEMRRLMQGCPVDYRKAGVLITDGNADEPALTEAAATSFKAQDYSLFVVGVGTNIQQAELRKLATQSPLLYYGVTFDEITALGQTIIALVCADLEAPTTTPIPTTGECLKCEFIHGLYIFNNKDYCYVFHSCVNYYQSYSLLRECPFGQFFDGLAATCKPANSIDCESDPCKVPGTVSYANHLRCRSYFVCDDLRTISEVCCPEGQAYVDQDSGCQDDPTCNNACPPEPRIADCSLRPYADDAQKFEQNLGGDNWKLMDCPIGTSYSDATCRCSDPGRRLPDPLCTADVYMPFDRNVQDVRRRKFVSRKNVRTVDAAAATGGRAADFNGNNGRLLVKGYANSWWGDTLTIRTSFMENPRSALPAGTMEVIFGNGACKVEASVSVKYDRANNRIRAILRTDEGGDTPFVAEVSPVSSGAFKQVELRYDGANLRLTVDNQVAEVEASGNIAVTQSTLQLGYGCLGHERFTGLEDEFYVYGGCNPT